MTVNPDMTPDILENRFKGSRQEGLQWEPSTAQLVTLSYRHGLSLSPVAQVPLGPAACVAHAAQQLELSGFEPL